MKAYEASPGGAGAANGCLAVGTTSQPPSVSSDALTEGFAMADLRDVFEGIDVHPAAQFFPVLTGAAYESFRADIAAQGLLEPIWLCEGKILDGRNRYRACQDLGLTPRFREYTGDSPVAFAWSLNGERRHLTNAQRAALGAEMLPALQEEAHARQVAMLKRGPDAAISAEIPVSADLQKSVKSRQGKAIEQAAQLVGASARNVQYARRVKERDPLTFERLKRGEVSVATAYRGARQKPAPRAPRCQPREVRLAAIRELASQGYRRAQIADELQVSEEHVGELAHGAGIVLPDAAFRNSRRINARQVIEESVSSLEGVAMGLRAIDSMNFEMTPAEAAEWAQSIEVSLRVINRVRKQLKEYASHE